jgi:hypothetical protein
MAPASKKVAKAAPQEAQPSRKATKAKPLKMVSTDAPFTPAVTRTKGRFSKLATSEAPAPNASTKAKPAPKKASKSNPTNSRAPKRAASLPLAPKRQRSQPVRFGSQ